MFNSPLPFAVTRAAFFKYANIVHYNFPLRKYEIQKNKEFQCFAASDTPSQRISMASLSRETVLSLKEK